MCGYAGEQINSMGRISGLDPAGPYYTGTAYFIHLDPTDAIYVDNIHTDADSIFMLGYGTAQPMGNVDFYPNSGHDQPGCDPVSIAIELITEDMIDSGRDFFACSHLKSIAYYQDTLVTQSCQWLAHECYDYNSFEMVLYKPRKQLCNERKSLFRANATNVKMITRNVPTQE